MTTVAQLIDQQTATVATYTAQADSFLQSLLNITNVSFSDGFNIDNLLPSGYQYATLPFIGFPAVAATFTPNLTVANTPPPDAPAVSLAAVSHIAMPSFLTSDLPAPTNEFEFFEAQYQSALLDAAKAKLLDNIFSGGYGIEPGDEAALVQRFRDRETQNAMARIAEAGRSMAIRGFPLPPGELNLTIDASWQEFQNKVADADREVYLKRNSLYVENRQFTIREARELEQILIGFHNSVQERAFNVARASVEMAIALYNAKLATYTSEDQFDHKASVGFIKIFGLPLKTYYQVQQAANGGAPKRAKA